MNDIYMPPARRTRAVGSFLKDFVWSTAGRFALHGLYVGPLEDRWGLLTERELYLPGLPEAFEGATVLHLSDVHCSPLMHERHIQAYVELANELEPDFVVLTGDFITTSSRDYARLAGTLLGQLRPGIAAMACLGNHDYGLWSPKLHNGVRDLAEHVAEQLEGAGIRTLVNEARSFQRPGGALHFVGLADLWSGSFDPARAFSGIGGKGPVIALCHNPDAAGLLGRQGADYILAGHTHGRQPDDTRLNKILFPAEDRRFVSGEYALPCGGRLYVNRGMGPSRRISRQHRPEIALFTLHAPVVATSTDGAAALAAVRAPRAQKKGRHAASPLTSECGREDSNLYAPKGTGT